MVVMQKNGVSNGSFDWEGVKQRIAEASAERVVSRAEKDAILAARARLLARPVEAVHAEKVHGLRLAAFALTGEKYGLEARLVIEISRLADFTPLPHSPDHLVGITNLRGEILP